MYFIVPFLFLCIIVWTALLMIAGGTLTFSGDKPIPAENKKPTAKSKPEPKKYFLVLPNGQEFELQPNEVAKAKKDKYKVVEK
jgi:hypothetical protein